MAVAKRDFGSFQASNVQELLQLPESQYEDPILPVEIPTFEEYRNSEQIPNFGKDMRQKHFLLEPDVTIINHGAFGGVLAESLDTSQKYQRYTERQPLRFYDRQLLPLLVHITRQLAGFVGCDPTDLVLVSNVTTANSSVIRGIPFTQDDTIFFLSTIYGATKKVLREVSRQTGVQLQEETLLLPVTGRHEIIELVRDKLKAGTRLAIFDHIPSNVPLTMPLEEIINICHERNIPVYIDGAHALGSQLLNLRNLRPTYYASNAHKWFSAPKGSAFLYVDKAEQSKVKPLIISHGYGSGFNSEFMWTGLHDYSPFLSLLVNINFWRMLGEDRIHSYMRSMIKQADSMALVQLPSSLHPEPPPSSKVDYSCAESIQNELYHKHNIEVPLKAVQGCLYVRISAHIYNELCEYEKLADAVLDIAARRMASSQGV
ncbi:probable L-cysteine desulfhydrase, chloroplastic [Argonauta hians]